jgi:hypothetical protein
MNHDATMFANALDFGVAITRFTGPRSRFTTMNSAPAADPWARSPEWQTVARELRALVEDLSAWAAVVLTPPSSGDALTCVAHYRLPEDWAALENRLDSGGMNARAFTTNCEVVDNDGVFVSPPGDEPTSEHRITASAVVLVPNTGTLEVLADSHGYRFEDEQLQRMRDSARRIASLV